MPQNIPMYQGEDFSQQLTFFSDVDMSVPLVFTHPVMDIRGADGSLLATFDDTGTQLGLMTITAPGVLQLSMAYTDTASIQAATFPVDIFADVGDSREAISKRGVLAIKVAKRITVDTGP